LSRAGWKRAGQGAAIDDDPLALQLIEAVLGPEGYVVLKATGGLEGIAIAQSEKPALVILDLLMPEVDGFEVVKQLRADPLTADIPSWSLRREAMNPHERDLLNGKISHLSRKATFKRRSSWSLVRGLCPTPAAPVRASRAAMAGELILVIEDNEKNLKLVRDLLQFTGS